MPRRSSEGRPFTTRRGKGFAAGYGEQGYRANVRTFIKRIPTKFRAVDPAFEHIHNYVGFGYRWTGD